ncbi:helix-turn-helix domain-containing protein [Streptomyces sp. NPDC059452]|uniref:helix-turn-helix domain-containing protein n=1 Tax=Streptomyces sp. NPDC059452 TaxID=3346835 RepID=UPI0036BDBEF7
MDELHGDHGSLAAQLRLLRTRRGLTLSALAKRTSYSRSSWERYLNGKALPPRTAITEFAAAVGVPATPLLRRREEEQEHRRPGFRNTLLHREPMEPGGTAHHNGPGRDGPSRDSQANDGQPGGSQALDCQEHGGQRHGGQGHDGSAPDEGEASAGADMSTSQGASGDGEAPGEVTGTTPGGPVRTGAPDSAPQPSRTRMTLVSAASACTALAAGILIGGWIFGGSDAEGQNREKAQGDPLCLEFECRDKDSQRMGCHIGAWTSAATWSGRTYIELRYSPRCRAAWARITDAHVDDTARVVGSRGVSNERSVTYENDTYSPMVEAPYPASARACGVIQGKETCTSAGGPSPMPPALTDEREPARRPAPTESG